MGRTLGTAIVVVLFFTQVLMAAEISYSVHVSGYGWLDEVTNGEIAGTTGESRRMEAIKINSDCNMYYRAHVSGKGWLSYETTNEIAGTVGEFRQLEAVQIKLLGCHDWQIKYQSYTTQFGWQDWVYDGEISGSVGESLAIEAIKVELVENNALNSEFSTQWISHQPTANRLFDIDWSEEQQQFIAVGINGTIISSNDGEVWHRQSSGTDTILNAIKWNGKQWLAVGGSGFILSSSDGVSWKKQAWQVKDSSDDISSYFNDVAWNGEYWVVVGARGVVVIGNDDTSWLAINATGPAYDYASINAIAWSGTQWHAVGTHGLYIKSSDGINWKNHSYSGLGREELNDIAWNGEKWIVVGGKGYPFSAQGTISTSVDGINWERQTQGEFADLYGIVWNGEYWLALGENGVWVDYGGGVFTDYYHRTGPCCILISSDGENWQATSPGISSTYFYTASWNGNKWVSVGNGVMDGTMNSLIVTSNNGMDWSDQTRLDVNIAASTLRWNGSQWLAVGKNGAIQTSPDGYTWSQQSSGTIHDLNDVAWNGSVWVAVGRNYYHDEDNRLIYGEAIILTSSNGIDWERQVSGIEVSLWGIAWNGKIWMAVGSNGAIITSNDGKKLATTTFASK